MSLTPKVKRSGLSALLTQQVEYLHGKQKVAGSNPAEGFASRTD